MPPTDLSLVGRHFLIEPGGTHLTDEELQLLDRLQPAAIMFRKRNFVQDVDYRVWLKTYNELLGQCRQVLHNERLLISVDHEGGRVIRPPAPITRFPYAAQWGSSVSLVAQAMAAELKSLGINVNFAPVADIHSNPDNPVINERAFGRTAKEVSAAAIKFAQELKESGITPCAKHFPGHGDTKVDSHWQTPVLDLSLPELKARELIPFQALIDAGIELVMTAHIVFPQIDPGNQATMSRKLLNDLLRHEMGFNGVIIADALGMAATVNKLSQRETVSRAINAGLDIFCVAGDTVNIKDAVKMAELMHEALELGEIAQSVLDQSQERIDGFIARLPQHSVVALDDAIFERHQALAQKLAVSDPWSSFELSLPGFE